MVNIYFEVEIAGPRDVVKSIRALPFGSCNISFKQESEGICRILLSGEMSGLDRLEGWRQWADDQVTDVGDPKFSIKISYSGDDTWYQTNTSFVFKFIPNGSANS